MSKQKREKKCLTPDCDLMALMGKRCGPCKDLYKEHNFITREIEVKREYSWTAEELDKWKELNIEYVKHHRLRTKRLIFCKPVDKSSRQ